MALALVKAHKSTKKHTYADRARAVMGYLSANPGGVEDVAVQAMVADALKPASLEFERVPVDGSLAFLLVISFIAGVLSFLSPCTLPLLPAYAVHTMKAKQNAVQRTLAFFIGLALVFSVLGVSVALIGQVLVKLVPRISMVAGVIIIGFGILTVLGKGFGGMKRKRLRDGSVGSFLFGASYGVAWTPCVGPILGSIFVIAAASSSWAKGGLLLFAYAIGIALPLLFFSYYIDRLNRRGRLWRFITGKGVTLRIGKWRVHTYTTNIIAGVLLIIIGYLIFSGTLYTINQFAVETPLQQRLFRLEDWLLGRLK